MTLLNQSWTAGSILAACAQPTNTCFAKRWDVASFCCIECLLSSWCSTMGWGSKLSMIVLPPSSCISASVPLLR